MRRADERGFAMLLVFLLASVVAIGLYLEMPRVALESQRQKEQLLIDRGEQYKRAIQLFYKKAGRYPAELKDLESFQNQRFLRRRYVDPLTGKDEWRLIHINNGALTDSLVNKPKTPGDQKDAATTAGQYVGIQAGLGETLNGPQTGGISARDRRRPSEGGNPADGQSNPGQLNPGQFNPGQFNPGQSQGPNGPGFPNINGDPSAPGNNPGNTLGNNGIVPPVQLNPGGFPGQIGGQPGMPSINGQPAVPGQSPFPGQTFPGQPFPGQTFPGQTFPGQTQGQPGVPTPFPIPQPPAQGSGSGAYVGSQPYVGTNGPYVGGGSVTGSNPGNPGGVPYPGQPMPGQPMPGQMFPGQPGAPVNSQTGGVSPYPAQGGVPYPQPGMTTGAPTPGTAADMINRILTTPRPGGMPQNNTGTAAIGMIGGGIAGVASTADGEGVKIYNDRALYKEWEFIFDPAKVKPLQNPNAVTSGPGTPASQMGSMPAQSGMTPVGGGPLNQSTPFGTPPKQP
ncbi:MAG TPA: hypothetical protein VNY05_40700 [Candidatus Acidoferrales bacterium]|jgi:hypothetical protein|nr:hypothetical protein [Candidatus Acidoferrales bacterium]